MKKPVIKSLAVFKKAIKKTELWNSFTGETKKVIQLYYGFSNTIALEGNNINEAYKEYKKDFEFCDYFINENSFLRQN